MKRDQTRRVLGVDPGSRTTGWGIIDHAPDGALTLVDCGSISAARSRTLPDRLVTVHDALVRIIEEYRPHALAIETAYSGPNVQSALRLGEVRAVAMLGARKRGLSVHEYPPARIKKAVTGLGNARKGRVRDLVVAALGEEVLHVAQDFDTTDALAAAICHVYDVGGLPEALAGIGVAAGSIGGGAKLGKRRKGSARFTAQDLARRGLLPEGS